MTQTHSVSFRPTSFLQLLSEMSGLDPQGMRSWGNGVRTEGAEQPERDWEGGLREWMRLWEQSREAGPRPKQVSHSGDLPLYPFPLTPKVTRWPGFWPSGPCLTHFPLAVAYHHFCPLAELSHLFIFLHSDFIYSLTLLFLSLGGKWIFLINCSLFKIKIPHPWQ